MGLENIGEFPCDVKDESDYICLMAHVLVLAGGLATRLHPITLSIPKCLVPCGGHSFVDYTLAWMGANGVRRATYVVGHLGEMVIEHLQSVRYPGLTVDWISEGDIRRGTGGAVDLACARGEVGEDFLLMYGDSFLPVDFSAVWESARRLRAPALMTVFHNRGELDRSNLHFQPPLVTLYSKDPEVQHHEKFQYVDFGLSYWRTEIWRKNSLNQAAWDLSTLMAKQAASGLMFGLEVHTRFYEIGSPTGLKDFDLLLQGKIDQKLSAVVHSHLKRLTTV